MIKWSLLCEKNHPQFPDDKKSNQLTSTVAKKQTIQNEVTQSYSEHIQNNNTQLSYPLNPETTLTSGQFIVEIRVTLSNLHRSVSLITCPTDFSNFSIPFTILIFPILLPSFFIMKEQYSRVTSYSSTTHGMVNSQKDDVIRISYGTCHIFGHAWNSLERALFNSLHEGRFSGPPSLDNTYEMRLSL